MSTAPEKDAIPAGHVRVTSKVTGHVRVTSKVTGLSHDIPKQAWEILGKTGQAEFEQSVPKPASK